MGASVAEQRDERLSKRKSSVGGVAIRLELMAHDLWGKHGIKVRSINVLADRVPQLIVVRATRGMDEKLVRFVPIKDLSYLVDGIARALQPDGYKADRPYSPDEAAAARRRELTHT